MSTKPTEDEVLAAMKHAIIDVTFSNDYPTTTLVITPERAEYLARRMHENLKTFFRGRNW